MVSSTLHRRACVGQLQRGPADRAIWNSFASQVRSCAGCLQWCRPLLSLIEPACSISYPFTEEEVQFAIKEYACTLGDVILRRLRLAFLNLQVARKVAPNVRMLTHARLV